MHKAVLSSETLLVKILKRAKELADEGIELYCTPSLKFFLYNKLGRIDLTVEGNFTPGIISAHFTKLDDTDILVSAKYWSDSSDKVLSDLSGRLLRRDLLAIELQNEPFSEGRVANLRTLAGDLMKVKPELDDYYVFTDCISNMAYAPDAPDIKILLKNGEIADISNVSNMFDHRFLSEKITKHFLCYPKECR